MADETQRPYYTPKQQREQSAILRAVTDLVKALAEAAPKLDGKCKVIEKKK